MRFPFKMDPPIDELATLSSAMKKEYDSFLSEYEQLRYMEKVPATSTSASLSQIVYIPHHTVVRNSSSIT